MTLKKMPKNKSDIKFIDPDTMEVVCSYNECFTKFVETSKYVIRTPSWNEYNPIKTKYYFHTCSECGRNYQNKDDKQKSLHYAETKDTFTIEEYKGILIELNKSYFLTKVCENAKKIEKAIKLIEDRLA